MRGRAAARLEDRGGKPREVFGTAPRSRCGAGVGPGELGKTVPLVVDELLVLDAGARLEDDDLDALLRQLVAQRAAAGAGADDHHNAAVVQIEFCHLRSPE